VKTIDREVNLGGIIGYIMEVFFFIGHTGIIGGGVVRQGVPYQG
jgi:hypothetical protein